MILITDEVALAYLYINLFTFLLCYYNFVLYLNKKSKGIFHTFQVVAYLWSRFWLSQLKDFLSFCPAYPKSRCWVPPAVEMGWGELAWTEASTESKHNGACLSTAETSLELSCETGKIIRKNRIRKGFHTMGKTGLVGSCRKASTKTTPLPPPEFHDCHNKDLVAKESVEYREWATVCLYCMWRREGSL